MLIQRNVFAEILSCKVQIVTRCARPCKMKLQRTFSEYYDTQVSYCYLDFHVCLTKNDINELKIQVLNECGLSSHFCGSLDENSSAQVNMTNSTVERHTR